jgi:lipoxygenase homology domain-containing protein 1
VIIDMPSGETMVFPCNKWFDSNEEDGKIERSLIPLGSDSKSPRNVNSREMLDATVNYDIVVKTSDLLGAGTDSNVFIKIYGDLRTTQRLELKKSKSHMNKFESGHSDQFRIKEENVGEIRKIK